MSEIRPLPLCCSSGRALRPCLSGAGVQRASRFRFEGWRQGKQLLVTNYGLATGMKKLLSLPWLRFWQLEYDYTGPRLIQRIQLA